MYGSNNMKKSVVFNNQFNLKFGGQFELENDGQFAPELVVNLHWKVVVNLTGFSTQSIRYKEIHPELDRPVLALQGISDDIYETIEIEKWVLMNSLN